MMLIVNDWRAARFSGVVLSIGNFDGVHRGHRAIIDAGLRRARAADTQLVLMTFEPHPATLLTPDRVPLTLTPLHHKIELLARAGVDALVIIEPTREFLSFTAEEFLEQVIAARFAPIALVEGPTFGFGAHRKGDVQMLAEAGSRYGFEVEVVQPVRVALGGHPETIVSSSLVRHLLTSGTVDGAALCLGRPYALFGKVRHGASRGRGLGFPTANLEVEAQLIPAEGVYAGRATTIVDHPGPPGAQDHIECVEYPASIPAAISIGRNPTFNEHELSVEAFLLDFQGDLYGQRLKLEFLQWLRPQQRFASPEALIAHIEQDVQTTREAFVRASKA